MVYTPLPYALKLLCFMAAFVYTYVLGMLLNLQNVELGLALIYSSLLFQST